MEEEEEDDEEVVMVEVVVKGKEQNHTNPRERSRGPFSRLIYAWL